MDFHFEKHNTQSNHESSNEVYGEMVTYFRNHLNNSDLKSRFMSFFQKSEQDGETQWTTLRRENIRPWMTFCNSSNFKTPLSLLKLSRRFIKNLEYFHLNYVILIFVLSIYCLLTSPLLLIVFAMTFGVAYKVKNKFPICGHELSIKQQYALVCVCSIPLFLLAGVTTVLMWLLGASCFIITIHAVFYNIDAVLNSEDSLELLVEEV